MRFHMVFYLVFLVFLVFLFGMIDFAGMPHDFSTDRASTDDHCRALPVQVGEPVTPSMQI